MGNKHKVEADTAVFMSRCIVHGMGIYKHVFSSSFVCDVLNIEFHSIPISLSFLLPICALTLFTTAVCAHFRREAVDGGCRLTHVYQRLFYLLPSFVQCRCVASPLLFAFDIKASKEKSDECSYCERDDDSENGDNNR